MGKTVKKKFKIEGMDCGACCMLIDGALEDIDGVKSSSTNYAKCECEVEFDPDKVKEKKIVQTIEEAGYKATAVTPANPQGTSW